MKRKPKLTIVRNGGKSKGKLRDSIKQNKKNIVMAVIGLIILFFAYLGSPLAKVKDISVKGVNDLGGQQVIEATDINTNTYVNNILFHKNKYKEKVQKKLETVRGINFKFKSFNHLIIVVNEYKTVGFLLKNDSYYRILETGRVLSEKNDIPIGHYPIYEGFKNKPKLMKVIKMYSALSSKIQNSISEIRYEPSKVNKNRIHIYMNDGNEVIADLRTASKKLKYYPSISNQMKEKGILDIEVGSFSYPFKH